MAETVVPLSRRYEAHGEAFDSVTVREPRFPDLMALGEPYEVQRLPGGGSVVIENVGVVADYVNRCVTSPTVDKLVELGVADARAVREGVLDFFRVGGTQKSA